MRILVTGGAGYLGCILVPQLLKNNFKVNVLDLFIYGDNVLQNHPNLKFSKVILDSKFKLGPLRIAIS